MTVESSSAAFRAQLAIPEQRQLFDYWLSRAGNRPMPHRSDISPADFPRLLPSISLLELDPENRLKVRLAGTRLRDIHDREVTGLYLDDFDFEGRDAYWHAAYARVIETGKPAQGAVRAPRLSKDHLVQFWLRLPLAAACGRPRMILCHDEIISVSEIPGELNQKIEAA